MAAARASAAGFNNNLLNQRIDAVSSMIAKNWHNLIKPSKVDVSAKDSRKGVITMEPL